MQLARRYKLDYAAQQQQETAVQAANQQELASLQEAPAVHVTNLPPAKPANVMSAANAADSVAAKEAIGDMLSETSCVSLATSRPAVIVAKIMLEGGADNSTASPKIAAVKPAVSVSGAATPTEQQAIVTPAGAASSEVANAAEVVSSAAGSLQQESAGTSAVKELLQGSIPSAASLPLEHSQVGLVYAAKVVGQLEDGHVSAACQQSTAPPVQGEDEKSEKECEDAQQEMLHVEKESGSAQPEIRHGVLPGRMRSPSLDREDKQVSHTCQ